MDPVFAWIEDGALSTWIRASPGIVLGFPGILVLHTLGMGFLAGTGALIGLRVLGLARQIPLAALERFFPVAWLALAVNAFSGVLLLIAYPTKALTNPVFYLKMALLALALVTLVMLRERALRAPHPRNVKTIAAASLVFWAGAITAGRFLAYTHTWLLVGVPAIR